MSDTDSREFWDRKILRWEEDKYAPATNAIGRLVDVNRSLKMRMRLAERILSQTVRNRTVLEIGCGTARLLPTIIACGATKYIGVDVSGLAIDRARLRAEDVGGNASIELYQGDVTSLSETSPDLCFSLGLLDWLDPERIAEMNRRIQCRYYFHSFSERRRSVQLLLHRMYVYCLYGHRTKSYVPRYYTSTEMAEIFQSGYGSAPQCFRSPELSFGSLVFQLPNEIKVN